jgi:hypothetical protein
VHCFVSLDDDNIEDGDSGDDSEGSSVVVANRTPRNNIPGPFVHPNEGRAWYPFHLAGEYVEKVTHRPHFQVLINLPTGVADKNNSKVKTKLEDGGKTLVVTAEYPSIMVEDGLEELFEKWDNDQRGDNFQRMQVGMDTSVCTVKQLFPNNTVFGIFKLGLPFVSDPIYVTKWILNKQGLRMIHIDFPKATLNLDQNKLEQWDV